MASELTVTHTSKFVKSGQSASFSNQSDRIDVTGSDYIESSQGIPITVWTLVAAGDIDVSGSLNVGHVSIKNLDSTNYIELSADSGGTYPLIKLGAGQSCSFPSDTNTIYARADTAECKIEKLMIEV